MQNPFAGIAKATEGRKDPRLALQRLGHQPPRAVVKVDVSKLDATDGLRVCPIDQIFADNDRTFIVFGNPNVSLVTYNEYEERWERLAAYMAWRKPAHIADTRGRIQAGVLFELCDLNPGAQLALSVAMDEIVGTRTASCAHAVALALHKAGFRTKSGVRLDRIYRNSHFGAVLWSDELTYRGEPVELRPIVTDKKAHYQFRAAWLRELNTIPRLLSKFRHKAGPTPAPVFEPSSSVLDAADEWPETGQRVRVSTNVPSAFGVNASYLSRVGPQPEFSIELPRPIDHHLLQRPLKPFDRKLTTVELIKSKVLFSPLTCWLMAKALEKEVATTDFIPVDVVAKMLTHAPMSQHENPDPIYKYNFVLTRTTLKVKRLLSNRGTENKFLAWMLAKHVLLSRWAKNILAAGELWICNDNGRLFVFINGESGSYRPSYAQITALAMVLTDMLDLSVHVSWNDAH